MRDPDITGKVARAWKIARKDPRPDAHATIAGWIVAGPFHPMWHQWMVGCVHLRPLEGCKPARKQYEQAEYEFLIASIHPDHEADPDDPGAGYALLEPIDVVEQFHGVSDRDAERICEAAVRAICDGLISPDQDYRSAWRTTLASTVQHYREGRHMES